ncbi:glycoside hydrolase family 97 protein [Parasediminibacterium sp. JCM 36343]|uniref:glycoside hydrolase family 97 protein n=1 Tax=Parasediminibacterium sp. JCM 36343 TaxID=3374279 RepID=UPI00397E17D6
MRKNIIVMLLFGITTNTIAQKPPKTFVVKSPNGKVVLNIAVGKKTSWGINHQLDTIIAPSTIALQLEGGEVLGDNAVIISAKTTTINETFKAINYKKDSVKNNANQLMLTCKGGYGLVFRAYDDGVAYRFFTSKKDSFIVKNEEANFNLDKDYKVLIPYVRDLRDHDPFSMAFEAMYDDIHISQFVKDSLAFLPSLINYGNNKKAVILEADLEDYPGMFITQNESKKGFNGVYAKYALEEQLGGFEMMNYMVRKRAAFIAKVSGTRNFPWRAIVISETDKELANNDMVQKLSAPSRIADVSWIKPGKVAWDWWNDWNITHVDFRAGINTPTYKYYIDFAAANKLEYIVLDEGWSEKGDILQIKPVIALQELIDYGKKKNVGIILWATWYGLNSKLDAALVKYSAMGIKGFKIDFMDRDDQKMVSSLYTIAQKAADYKLVVDYHGMYKPTGLQKTYPNVLNFEGVKGMENEKWTPNDNVPLYDVTLPYIRMMAGPMDYTPGAMRNATKSAFRPDGAMPMAQGTRCHQLAMYVVFEAPLQMLADNPTVYKKEQECTNFIAKVPTVFDATVALGGNVGEYIAIARRKGDTWFVGAMGNWQERDIEIDFSFLGAGNYEAEIFKDGINADRDATDYKKYILKVAAGDKVKVHLSNGGGWAARVYKK